MDRKCYLTAKYKLENNGESASASDRFELRSPPKKRRRKRGPRRRRPKVASTETVNPVPSCSNNTTHGKRKHAEQSTGSAEREIPTIIITPPTPVKDTGVLTENESSPRKRKKKHRQKSGESPAPDRREKASGKRKRKTDRPVVETPPGSPLSVMEDENPRSPSPPPIESSRPKTRIVYHVEPMDTSDDVPLILDHRTGELRPKTPEDNVSDADDSSLEIDYDEAEDDDFGERNYPASETDATDSETEVNASMKLAGEASHSRWRPATERDNEALKSPPFEPTSGPSHPFPSHAREIEYFYRYIPAKLIQLAVAETNKYAVFHQRNIARKINSRWRITNFNEMQAFIGIIICMGVDRKTACQDYWSSDPFLQNSGVASVMTFARYQLLMRYFHLADPASDPRRDSDEERRKRRCMEDPLYKINPWLKPILANCLNNYQPGQELSIDEGMVRFKGRSKFKQRMPHKPDRDGFKVWQVSDSKTAYVVNFEPYLGVKYKSLPEGQKKERDTIHKLTKSLLEPFANKNHIVFSDTLFTSVKTAEQLAEKEIYMVGSYSRRNRKAMPPQLIPEGKQKKLKLKTGEMTAVTRVNESGEADLNITAYQDEHAQVLILNTAYPPLETERVGNGERAVPVSLLNYRKFMGGVDRSNQKRKYYHTGRKNNRWWIYMACYLIDIALLNAYECYKFTHPATKLTHKKFHLNVGKQLIGGHSSRLQKSCREIGATPRDSTFIRAENLVSHQIAKLPGRQKTCKQCSKDGRRTQSGRMPETCKGCELCKIHLHPGECFAAFHNNMVLRGRKTVGTQTLPQESLPPRGRRQASRSSTKK